MLIKGQEIVAGAFKGGWAIGAFNTNNLETTQAIFEGGSEVRAPIFIQVSLKALDYAGFEELVGLIKLKTQHSRLPSASPQANGGQAKLKTVLHLDHAKEPKLVKKAIEAGFTSVMYDGSSLPLKENIRITSELAKLAHQKGVSIEGEVDSIGGREDYIKGKIHYTDPQNAFEFAEKTKVDYLAVAIGNTHGAKVPGEKLDFELLSKIHKEVAIPLVLHGSSNSTDEEFKRAIDLGIAKINIDTELRQAFAEAIRKFLKENPDEFDPRKILTPATEAMKKVVEDRLRLFGAANKGLG